MIDFVGWATLFCPRLFSAPRGQKNAAHPTCCVMFSALTKNDAKGRLQKQRDKSDNGAPLKRSKAFSGRALVGEGYFHIVATVPLVLWRLAWLGFSRLMSG